MAFSMSLIDRVEREYDVTVLLAGGGNSLVGVLSFAVVRPNVKLSAITTWVDFPVNGGIAKVIYAAPAAVNKTGAIVVPTGGANVYAREVNGDLVKAVFVEQIAVS